MGANAAPALLLSFIVNIKIQVKVITDTQLALLKSFLLKSIPVFINAKLLIYSTTGLMHCLFTAHRSPDHSIHRVTEDQAGTGEAVGHLRSRW